MTVRAALIRVLGVSSIMAAVFYASFFLTVAMRAGTENAMSATLPFGDPIIVSATTAAPLISGEATLVATTAPTTSSTTTTTTFVPPTPSVPVGLIDELGIASVFDPIHDRLATEVEVPIRLPATLGPGATDWVPTIRSITEAGYVVHIGEGEDCNGGSACRILTFTAQRSMRLNPELVTRGTEVPLPNELTGVFSDGTCGADCTNGFITWIEGNVRYSVGSRVASGPAVLDLAWRSIARSLPTPSGPDVCGPGAPKHSGRVARTKETVLTDGRTMHWIAVCSEDGTDIEMIIDHGDVTWADVDRDGVYNIAATHADGTTTIFAMDGNRPHAAIDVSTGGRLLIGTLECATTSSGEHIVIDRSTNERLNFINAVTVRRSDDLPASSTQTSC